MSRPLAAALVVALVILAVLLCRPGREVPVECPPPPLLSDRIPGEFDLRYPHHPSQLIVGLTDTVGGDEERRRRDARAKLLRDLSLHPDELSASLRIYRLTLQRESGDEALERMAETLRAQESLFRFVEPNACVYFEQVEDIDPHREHQWALDKIHVEDVWQTTPGSPDVTVAVIDSGIATDHLDLSERLWQNPCEPYDTATGEDCPENDTKDGDLHGWNFVDDTGDVDDLFDHGSQVAGIVGAVHMNKVCIQGVAQDVSLMALKIGESDHAHVDKAVSALEYAAEQGVDVVNASWTTDFTMGLFEELQAANEAGIVVVAAAGRGGKAVDLDKNPSYPCSFGLSNVVCVAATDEDDSLWSGSSWGQETVDLGAPGHEIYSTTRVGCASRSGTSMAAPYVSGVAALVRSKCPAASVDEVVKRLVWSGQEVPALVEKTISGRRLDAKRALAAPCFGDAEDQR